MDLALVAHSASLTSRIPFLHIFDGFRTSHELQKISVLPDDVISELIDDTAVEQFRERSMSPDRPTMRGTAQNPDVFFQARASVNPYYERATEQNQAAMDKLATLTGRSYHIVDYVGHPEAERVVVL